MTLDRFYPIFDRADWLPRMLPLGMKLVQLRIKDQPLDVVRTDIRTAKTLCAEYGCTLVINDFWEIAIDERCDFIHLGQEDLDVADMSAIKKAGLRVGLSTHDETELDRALSYNPEYVALGPVYPTILKKMKWTQQGLERVTEWKKLLGDTPLVGIGGMSVERAQGVFEAGADIVSAVTDITLNTNPEARLSEWIGATR
jgi:thiamine-phosphate pyrophosphorylase